MQDILQIVGTSMLRGRNGRFFPQKLFETYQYAAESGDCITYAGIPMYTGKTMQEMLKMNYEHFVLDFGSIEREQFACFFIFDERMRACDCCRDEATGVDAHKVCACKCTV